MIFKTPCPVFTKKKNNAVPVNSGKNLQRIGYPKQTLHYSASVSVRNIVPMFSWITCQSGENKELGAKKSTFETQSCGVCSSKTNVVIQFDLETF